ncbi:MAG: DUF5689 domain-containing protein [Rikenellaceae bacterium]|jgi:hypothetical protein|nr:DUF5689 domain-containing protein [Rikenellaceae bacterium]
MKKILYILAFVAAGVFAGCEKAEIPDAERIWTLDELLAEKGGRHITIAEFKSLYTGQPTVVEEDFVIGGRVVSTDEFGNFYRSFYIEDETGAIEIRLGPSSGIYLQYPLGMEVFVKTYHLTLGNYGGMLSIGYKAPGGSTYENSYLTAKMLIDLSLYKGQIYKPLDPVQITPSTTITDDMYGEYVELVGAVYAGGKNGLKTWATQPDPNIDNDQGAVGEQNFTIGGTTVVVRTSGYSDFAYKTVPFAVGDKVDVSGVLTRFNENIQMVLNTDKDAVAAQ